MNVVQQGGEADARYELDRPDEMGLSESQRLHGVPNGAVL
jgi:hypothetical protein